MMYIGRRRSIKEMKIFKGLQLWTIYQNISKYNTINKYIQSYTIHSWKPLKIFLFHFCLYCNSHPIHSTFRPHSSHPRVRLRGEHKHTFLYSEHQYIFFYKQVETIGDAYCVASGLQGSTSTHAQQIAWMALKMVAACANHLTHMGDPIKVSELQSNFKVRGCCVL